MPSARVYGGVPQVERHERRRQKLLEAALDCLGEEGLKGLSVRALCARAGLTSRYFYESFEDLNALLVALFDRVVEEVAQAGLAAIAAAPHDALARALAGLDAGVGVVADDVRKAKVLLLSNAGPAPLQQRRREQLQRLAHIMGRTMREFYGANQVTATDARLTTTALTAGFVELIGEWLAGSLSISRARLVEHMARTFVAAATVHTTHASRAQANGDSQR